METIITSPRKFSILPHDCHELFLGGSIEVGKATDWQSILITRLSYLVEQRKLRLYNPRRLDWDPEWNEESPELRRQIRWELMALERVDTVFFYFEPGTMSPITLLEFGKYVDSGKAIVVCPPGFWRRPNVLETASFYGTEVLDSLEQGIERIVERIITLT